MPPTLVSMTRSDSLRSPSLSAVECFDGLERLPLVLGGRCFDDFPFVDDRLLLLFFAPNRSLLRPRGDEAFSFEPDEPPSSLIPGAYCDARLLSTDV